MKTQAALLFSPLGKWETVEADLDEPKTGEVLVQMVASGLCHSDDHIVTGDFPPRHLPVCGGHEGSGIVRGVGLGVTDLEVGDHVVTSFIPSCGQCRWCAAGQQHLCDTGRQWGSGAMLDGTYRMHFDGRDVSLNSLVGTFSEWQVVNQRSLVKVSKDLPLDVICLVSCGVPTGWGSATTAASIEPGDVVVVMGCGGIGMNAVQGAAHQGAGHVVAVDIGPLKRETALRLGATHAYDNMVEALEFIRSVTNGQGADVAIACTGVLTGEHIGECFGAVRKAGTVVVTGLGNGQEAIIPVNLSELTLYQKRIQGALYGNASPRKQIPQLLGLYGRGILKLDELITRRYPLDQVNSGYADMHAGKNVRGIIDFGVR